MKTLIVPADLPTIPPALLVPCQIFLDLLLSRFDALKRLPADEYILFNSRYLRRRLGRQYMAPIRCLMRNGVIECNNSYKAGVKPKGYRLAPHYRNGNFTHVMVKDKRLAARLATFDGENVILRKNGIDRPLYHWLCRLTIDEMAARQEIASMQKRGRHERAIEKILNICGGGAHFHADEYGRIHTNLTSMLRDLRQHLRADGQPLWQIDISCSQPSFVVPMMIKEGMPEHFYRAYASDVQGGVFYERLQMVDSGLFAKHYANEKSLATRNKEPCPTQREAAKKIFNYVAFAEQGDSKISSKIFRAAYPHVYDWIQAYKVRHADPTDPKPYAVLARHLQRHEAEYVIENVCKTILREMPQVPLFTIHDAICTTEEHIYLVHDYMKRCAVDQDLTITLKPAEPL